MTAVVYRCMSLFAPVAVLAVLGIGISHMPHAYGLSPVQHGHFGLGSGVPLLLGSTVTPDLKSALDKLDAGLTAFIAKQESRLLGIEQKLTAPNGRGGPGGESSTPGALLVESKGFEALKSGARSSGQVSIGSFHKTAVVNATGQNQPLVQDYRVPGIIFPSQQRLTVRDLLPSFPTVSNLVQFAKESSFTNNAASQTGGSPNSGENVTKAESALAFSLSNAAVQTISHWIPASKQIIDDAPGLSAYINGRLLYFLKLQEEAQLLNGSGSANTLSGLVTNATPFDTTPVDTTNDTYIDIIRRGITQVQLSQLEPSGIVLHPRDWEHIQLTKTTGTALNGQYIFSNPHVVEDNKIWGLPVVPTVSMPQGQFLVGAFNLAAAIWDRADATVEVSREHASFFVQNMVAILCEERLTLTVFRPLALVYGGFPLGS